MALIDSGYERSPGSFNVVMGGLIPELDALGSEVNGQPLSGLIRGLSARAHIHRDVGFNLYGDYHQGRWEPFDDDLPEPIRHPETLRRKYRGVRVDRLPEGQRLFETGQVVKHWGCASISASSLAFLVQDRDIREVARTVTCYFETYFIEDIDRWSRFLPIYHDHWGPGAKFWWPHDHKLNICSAWMAGDQSHIDAIATRAFRKAEMTEEDALAELLYEQATVRTRKVRPEFLLRNVQAKNRRAGWLMPAREIVQICEGIGAPYPPHTLDFSDIERLHQHARKYIKDNKKELRKYGL